MNGRVATRSEHWQGCSQQPEICGGEEGHTHIELLDRLCRRKRSTWKDVRHCPEQRGDRGEFGGVNEVEMKHVPTYLLIEMDTSRVKKLDGLPERVLLLEPIFRVLPDHNVKQKNQECQTHPAHGSLCLCRLSFPRVDTKAEDRRHQTASGVTWLNTTLCVHCAVEELWEGHNQL